MKPLRTFRAQLIILFALFFFFLSSLMLCIVLLFPTILGLKGLILLSVAGTLMYSLIVFCILFIWKKSPTEMEQMGYLLDSLAEGIIVIDRHVRIRMMNRMAADYLAINAELSIGQSFRSRVPAAYIQLVEEALKLQKPVTGVVKGKRMGSIFDVTAICHEKQRFVILLIQDQTNVHKAVELARDFISNASHELKTPIAIVSGFAETLHDHPELSIEIRNDITGRIVDNCERMVSLVKSLLTLAAIDEGLPGDRLHKCAAKEIVEKARDVVLAIHPLAEITLIEESPNVSVRGDRDLLLQAVINLLDNAIKYSREEPKIHVILSQDQTNTKIAVRDFGRGIAEENLERIFQRFYAIDKSLSRNLGGYGLGLSIVQSIVERHHGHIDVASELGKGSTFTLRIPKKS